MAAKIKVNLINPKVNEIINSLSELIYDQNATQIIRNGALKITNALSNGNGSIEKRKNIALQVLEEMVSDNNLDMRTRTILFSTITLVESLSAE
ncbi:TPA: UPF0147 family protein [archaeon]|uniref:UPF0147 family protein n=1 Tax=Candidatus Naiadarchaeum limnaeum TaxID=2756139 RepID=A0A832V1U0_9ARCH|nr:UPF0147 family protein [Candidatus Naiadarchaeales archaeon SRR2090153.bin1042]HIK00618.1 UPF0147 family protein [Candidatus Naiadarchaeum limnaeum]